MSQANREKAMDAVEQFEYWMGILKDAEQRATDELVSAGYQVGTESFFYALEKRFENNNKFRRALSKRDTFQSRAQMYALIALLEEATE